MPLPRTHFFHVQSGFVLRHILKNVQIALVTKSIRASPCFNVVSLKIVYIARVLKLMHSYYMEVCSEHIKYAIAHLKCG